MSNSFSLIFLLTITGSSFADYCAICKDHTMCKFRDIGPTCGGDSESGVTQSDADEIVRIHNFYRSKIAKGRENRGAPGPQPPAANMNAFVWDDKLAEVAQRWANQCTFQHDKCRHDPRFKVSQNIYWSSGLPKVDWKRAISAWYDEVKKFDGTTTSSFEFSEEIGHYTQMIWGNTRYIGCGRTTYGGAYRLEGYSPREYILSTDPIAEFNATESASSGDERLVRKTHPLGYFGGAAFDPNGIRGSMGINSPGNGSIKPQYGNRPSNMRPGYQYGNGFTRPQYGSYRPFYENPSFSWRPALWLYPTRVKMSRAKLCDAINNVTHPQPVQSPVQHQLPSYAEWQQAAIDSSQEQVNADDNIEDEKLSRNEWTSVEYKFTGRDQILICNYGPAGNYQSQPVYIPGKTCSKCPAGTFCKDGLCA